MRVILYTLSVLLFASTTQAQETLLLRFPTIHDDTVVFSHAGNLYSASTKGEGLARRLTSHEGYEIFPRFSPDGKTLAFTGQYDGNTEVYTMPADGGVPKRLTFTATLGRDDIGDRMGPNNIVMAWKPNGKEIVFRSRMHSFNDFVGSLYSVKVDGGLPEQLPVPRGGFCSFNADGTKMAYNKVFREFRTWKRYRGGMADEVWIHDFATKKTEQITDTDAQDIIPMWAGTKIYYISDRDESKRYNIYCYDTEGKTTRQVTHFTDFDIKFPSLGNKAIVFEKGGALWKMDLNSEKTEKLTITIKDDFTAARNSLKNVGKEITTYEASPDGKRALFGARGDVFSVPATSGIVRNLTNTPGVHERNATWSPDLKTIAYISDATGEDEIHLVPQDGSDAGKPLTTGGDCYKFNIVWSPDSKKIAWSDRKQRLRFIDVESKKVTDVVTSKAFEIRDFAWSPDSKWLAYTLPERDGMSKIYLYDVLKAASTEVTDIWYGSNSPRFSSDGKYLFFVSNRDFNPIYSNTEWNHAYVDMARVYFVTLAKDTENPLKPRLDEANSAAPAAKPTEPLNVKVDLDGIKDRTLALNVPAASYRNLQAAGGLVYYIRSGFKQPGVFAAYDLAANKELNLGAVDSFDVTTDGKKMMVNRGGAHGIIDLPKAPFEFKTIDVSGLEMRHDPQVEWKQVYNECWRQMRDFFYAPNMHGVDWPAMKAKYEPLLAHVHHRADLQFVIGEMIAELNAGHAYINSPGQTNPNPIPMGLLGARLSQDPATRYVKIDKILKGAGWNGKLRSPLNELGVDVKEGEYIVAVNGTPVNEATNLQELLVNTVGKPVQLKVNKEPNAKGARTVVVTPIKDESDLYYFDWVQANIKKVSDATDGRVGYLHVPDMSQVGLNEFVKHFYPQIGKTALVIDVRGNGGGNVSPMLIERLRREIAMFGIARNGQPTVEPTGTFNGPMVCLLNEYSASDGDLFAFRFKNYKMGPLIGKRSWGGVVGIRGSLPLLDGFDLRKPEFSRFDVAGQNWIIENHGVEPDIIVDNDPAKEMAGEDQQLTRAIEEIVKKLKTEEKKTPAIPPFPKR